MERMKKKTPASVDRSGRLWVKAFDSVSHLPNRFGQCMMIDEIASCVDISGYSSLTKRSKNTVVFGSSPRKYS